MTEVQSSIEMAQEHAEALAQIMTNYLNREDVQPHALFILKILRMSIDQTLAQTSKNKREKVRKKMRKRK